jgi:uncharacterized protein (TIGR02145 family)
MITRLNVNHMKKTIIAVTGLLAIVAISADRIGFKTCERVNGLDWKVYNVGSSERNLIGYNYSFTEAQTACPEGWRLPTRQELEALAKNYSPTVKYKEMTGRWFTGHKYYSKKAAGLFFPRTELVSAFDSGTYWSSTLYDKDNAYCLVFNAKNVNVTFVNCSNRCAVRCVKK